MSYRLESRRERGRRSATSAAHEEMVLLGHEKRGANTDAHNLSKAAATLSAGRRLWLLDTP